MAAADSEANEPPPPTAEAFCASLVASLGSHYRISQDGVFHWVTPFAPDAHERFAQQARYAIARVGQTIPGLVTTPPDGGWPAVLFSSVDEQLAYEGLFGGAGAQIINGGVWRNWPIGHLAIPVNQWDALDAAFGHELVHACLSDTGVPVWLQEGLATELETGMGNRVAPLNDLHQWKETLAWWRSHPPDPFWTGEAFSNPESSRHAYALAQVIALRLTHRPDRLRLACTIGWEAWEDQDTAVRQLMGGDRATVFQAVIGEGRKQGWLERFLYWCFVGDRP
jgi:hypothetical protein